MRKRLVHAQRIKPECLETYLEHHRNVWSELEQAYQAAGITDLSCFVHGNNLLVYMEIDEDIYREKQQWLANHPIEQKWQATMNELKDLAAQNTTYGEVYRFAKPE